MQLQAFAIAQDQFNWRMRREELRKVSMNLPADTVGPRNAKTPDAMPLALVGCGAIAESLYLPVLAKRIDLTNGLILVDSDERRLRFVSERYNIRRYASCVDNVIGEVAGAIVAVPHHLHFDIASAFLSCRKPVLLEKPISVTASEATALVDLACRNGTVLLVNNLRRLYPSHREVRRLLRERVLGAPLTIRWTEGQANNWPTTSGFYFRQSTCARGIILDVGSHVFDILRWWLGERPIVLCAETDSFGGPEAVARVVFQWGNCEAEVRLNHFYKQENKFVIRCEDGVIEGIYNEWNLLSWARTGQGLRKHKLPCRYFSYRDIGAKIIRNFIDCLNGRGTPLIDPAELVDSMAMIDEAYTKSTRFEMPWYSALGVRA
jgi:predicted dehydrogenase